MGTECSASRASPVSWSPDRRELQDDREVVGQLDAAGIEARLEVGLLEPQDRPAAVAGVAVGPVGQVGAGLALHVEGGHVVRLHLADRRPVEMVEEGRERLGVPVRAARRTTAAMSSSRARSSSSGYQSSQEAASRVAATSWSRRASLVIGLPRSAPAAQVHPHRVERDEHLRRLPLLERVEGLDGHRDRAPGRVAERARGIVRVAVVVDGAGQLLEVARRLGVRLRDDVAVLVLGDREEPVHLVDGLLGHADGLGDRRHGARVRG